MRPQAVVPTERNKWLVGLVTLIVALALVDSLVAGTWDLVVVLGLAVILLLVLIGSFGAARPALTVRGDLFRWLDQRSAATGEPLERIADRCIAAYRAGLTGQPEDDQGPG